MAIGAMFVLFGFVIVKYNFRRKSKRYNHKMPSGNILAVTLVIMGFILVGYGYVHERPKLSPKEMLLESKSISELDLSEESFTREDDSKKSFLSEVSSFAKKEKE
jgi:NADH:ubiquinone oxidoreductase subunit 6 (subunit J)